MNEISCRPGLVTSGIPIPNDLGDLTNRENRAFRPRFINDYNTADGVADDNNGDGLDDYYPTMYYDGVGHSRMNGTGQTVDWVPNQFGPQWRPARAGFHQRKSSRRAGNAPILRCLCISLYLPGNVLGPRWFVRGLQRQRHTAD